MPVSDDPLVAGPDNRHPVGKWRVLAGAGIGNALESYDWAIYAIYAPFFASQFFTDADPVANFLSTLVVFAAGFLMRPLGGWLFGRLADIRGRRLALTGSMSGVALGSALIAISPTYATVGVLAPILLVVARLAQGLAHGGEISVAYTYVAEMAPPRRRGLWSSSVYIAVSIGFLLASGLGGVLTSVLDESQMAAWGWRVPFALGACLGIYALYLRRTLSETHPFTTEEQTAADSRGRASWAAVWKHRRALIVIVFLNAGATVFYYTWAVAAPGYAITVLGADPSEALWASVAANVVFLAALPIAGKLSDRFGRRWSWMLFAVGAALIAFPLNMLVGAEAWRLGLAMSLALMLLAFVGSIAPAHFAELLPTRVRATGTAVPYSVAVALFGGTAPYLQTWLGSNGLSVVFTAYGAALAIVTLIAVAFIPETKGRDLNAAESEWTLVGGRAA